MQKEKRMRGNEFKKSNGVLHTQIQTIDPTKCQLKHSNFQKSFSANFNTTNAIYHINTFWNVWYPSLKYNIQRIMDHPKIDETPRTHFQWKLIIAEFLQQLIGCTTICNETCNEEFKSLWRPCLVKSRSSRYQMRELGWRRNNVLIA